MIVPHGRRAHETLLHLIEDLDQSEREDILAKVSKHDRVALSRALDYAEKADTLENGIVEDIGGRTLDCYQAWHRELALIRDHSPFFADRDKRLLQ